MGKDEKAIMHLKTAIMILCNELGWNEELIKADIESKNKQQLTTDFMNIKALMITSENARIMDLLIDNGYDPNKNAKGHRRIRDLAEVGAAVENAFKNGYVMRHYNFEKGNLLEAPLIKSIQELMNISHKKE